MEGRRRPAENRRIFTAETAEKDRGLHLGAPGWPKLDWDEAALSQPLALASLEQGRLQGRMAALGFDLRQEAHLRALTEDVVKSSEIEGESLDPNEVRSSIARRLGMDIAGLVPSGRQVDGVVESHIPR